MSLLRGFVIYIPGSVIDDTEANLDLASWMANWKSPS